jgi:hypothetical protein
MRTKPFWCYRMDECRALTRRLDRYVHEIPVAERLDIFNGIKKPRKEKKS